MKTLNKAAKKNTYVIDCSNFNYLLFSEQPITPLIIIEKNGKPISDFGTSKKTPSLQFPNPCAYEMTINYKNFESVMGKLAQTIIEYLDKDTNETVAILFPTNEIMCREDYPDFEKRLNHESRKDLQYQMKLREKYLKRIKVR